MYRLKMPARREISQRIEAMTKRFGSIIETVGRTPDAVICQFRRAARAYGQQARGPARVCRPQCDPVLGQIEIEPVDAHGYNIAMVGGMPTRYPWLGNHP
jgi:hypothetical protein